jgi:hypothetical protein
MSQAGQGEGCDVDWWPGKLGSTGVPLKKLISTLTPT